MLELSIRDDGRGGADPTCGSGLIGLADRVDALGGTIRMVSPVGQGTMLHVALPIEPSLPRAWSAAARTAQCKRDPGSPFPADQSVGTGDRRRAVLSVNTVRTHMRRVYAKLGAQTNEGFIRRTMGSPSVPVNPQARLWRPSCQDSRSPHRNGAGRGAGSPYTVPTEAGAAELDRG
jgi:hypothetical protein